MIIIKIQNNLVKYMKIKPSEIFYVLKNNKFLQLTCFHMHTVFPLINAPAAY